MELKSLTLQRWDKARPVQGTIEFFNGEGEIKITLKPEHINKVIAVVADALVESSKAVAEDLTAAILVASTAGNILEHKPEQ